MSTMKLVFMHPVRYERESYPHAITRTNTLLDRYGWVLKLASNGHILAMANQMYTSKKLMVERAKQILGVEAFAYSFTAGTSIVALRNDEVIEVVDEINCLTDKDVLYEQISTGDYTLRALANEVNR